MFCGNDGFSGFVNGFSAFESAARPADDRYESGGGHRSCCDAFCGGEFFAGHRINAFGCSFIIIIAGDFAGKVADAVPCFFVPWFIGFFFSLFLKPSCFGLLGFCVNIARSLFFCRHDAFVDFIAVESFFVIVHRGCAFPVAGGLHENGIFAEHCVVQRF
ncbi:hypothetical protein BN2127_JRS5_00516 [Bacillus amyloliquefaciens]|nr:hypothetical protein BN2127_JRS5_00516 [Bacillus amyloliquefaciens]